MSRFLYVPRDCTHEGFHDIRTVYDRQRGLLLFYWTCESCGSRLGEAHRDEYRPQFDADGNADYLAPTS